MIKKITIVFIFLIAVGFGALYYYQHSQVPPEMKNWETETNLPLIGRNNSYDLLFLGSSHARIFSRFHNHQRVEKILGQSIINLSQGAERGGIISQHTYLSYFYFNRNTAATVVYFIDPFFFFRRNLDDGEHILSNEPFRRNFYRVARDEGINKDALKVYQGNGDTPLSPSEFDMYFKERQDAAMTEIDQEKLDARIAFLYQDGYNEQHFRKSFDKLAKTVREAKKHSARVVFVIPATLIPPQPDDYRVTEALQNAAKKEGYELYDFSEAITDPSFYYDVDHLNTKGIEKFTKEFLKPVLHQK